MCHARTLAAQPPVHGDPLRVQPAAYPRCAGSVLSTSRELGRSDAGSNQPGLIAWRFKYSNKGVLAEWHQPIVAMSSPAPRNTGTYFEKNFQNLQQNSVKNQ